MPASGWLSRHNRGPLQALLQHPLRPQSGKRAVVLQQRGRFGHGTPKIFCCQTGRFFCVPQHHFVCSHLSLCPCNHPCVPALSFLSQYITFCPCAPLCIPAHYSVSLHCSVSLHIILCFYKPLRVSAHPLVPHRLGVTLTCRTFSSE